MTTMSRLLSNLFGFDKLPRPDDSEETLLGPSSDSKENGVQLRGPTRYIHWHFASHGILLFACAFFFGSWVRSQSTCMDIPYSPSNVAIEYQRQFTIFNGSFEYPSIYRGEPTEELDNAWHRISKGVSLVRLTQDELLKLGKQDTPSKVKFSKADGGGYMAFLEVAHELHCLNVLRKYLHFDYYGKTDPFFSESEPRIYRTHLEHCIENLRQSIMCTANNGVITFEWVRGFSTPYPDFNTRHKCRDFEKMIGWQNSRGIHNVPQSHVVRLDGEVDLKQVP